MASSALHNVFVGAETGLLKGINAITKSWENINTIDAVNKSNEIKSMCWKNEEEKELFVGMKKGKILVYDTVDSVVSNELNLPIDAVKSNLASLKVQGARLISGVDNGVVQIWGSEGNCIDDITTGGNLHCMAQREDLLATGGKETELKIWDLQNTNTPIFKAKNVKNDWLNLRVPVWVTGIEFIPSSDRVVTCTGHHQIRLYDPKSSKRRPVLDMEFDEYPVTAISLRRTNENQVVVGNTQGKMALVDLRKGEMIHHFRGFAGGIRDIQCHPDLPIVATCGMDRYLCLHDINSKKLLHKYYLKSRLNCLLICKNWTLERNTELNSNAGSEEVSSEGEVEDEIWQSMEVVKTKTLKRTKSDRSVVHGMEEKKKKDEENKQMPKSVLRKKNKKRK